MLEVELKTYTKEKKILLKEHENEFVLIKENKIEGIFETQNDAIRVGISKFGNSPFLVKKIVEREQIQNFTSRLIKCDS